MTDEQLQDIEDFISDIEDAMVDLGLKNDDTIGELMEALEESSGVDESGDEDNKQRRP